LSIQNSAGTVLAEFDSAGNLGIGTTALTTAGGYGSITLDGSNGTLWSAKVAGTETFRIQPTSASTVINGIANLPMIFQTNSAERMRILATGELCIGTASAGAFVHIRRDSGAGNNYITSSILQTTDQRLILKAYWEAGVGQFAAIDSTTDSGGAQPLVIQTGGTERMRVMGAGSVGIGTSSPSYPLDVRATTGQINVSSTTGTNYARYLIQNSGGSFQVGIDSSTGSNFGLGGYSRVIWSDSAYPLVITTNATERMRILSGGDVGIGTPTPAAKLDVNGSINSNNLSSVNALLNSSFNVWQRGTALSLAGGTTAANGYLADRWQTATSANQASTISRQATGDTTNLPNIQYCLRFQRNLGQTATNEMGFYQSLETANAIPFVGKQVTFSFYARAGGNYSPTSGALDMNIYTGAGTDQSVFAYTSITNIMNVTKTLTTTWQRFTATTTITAGVTEFAVGVEWTPVGTAGVSDYFEITGVQLELGNVATPYRSNQPTYATELAACQRYFQRLDSSNDASLDFGNGAFLNTTLFRSVIPLKVTMRSAPTHDFGTAANFQITSSANFTPASTTLNTSSPNQFCIGLAVTGATAGYGGLLRANSSTSAYMNLSAEL